MLVNFVFWLCIIKRALYYKGRKTLLDKEGLMDAVLLEASGD